MTGEEDEDRTVFRPGGGVAPGGATPPQAPPPQAAPPSPGGGGYVPPQPQTVTAGGGFAEAKASAGGGKAELNFAFAEPDLYGPEPLVAAAGRLIHLTNTIRAMPVGPDLGALRQLVIKELEAFGPRARNLGLEPQSIKLAHYILCAFVDDAVMSTPWGANSPWSSRSLLAAYHNDTEGGARMFQFAERMEQDPNREPRLMELLYHCLSLGFEGRAAMEPRGQTMLHERRSRLAAAINRQRNAQTGDISPQWRGQTVPTGQFAPQIPLWAIVSAAAAIALLIFGALLFRLSTKADVALAALDRAVGGAEIVPPPPPPQSQTPTYDKMQQILQPDIASGRLELLREGNQIIIRLHNQGLFASAQAEPASNWSDSFGRITQAANLTNGPMRIEGHTDNQAIRSLEFPSNQDLSVARAAAVGEALAGAGLGDKSRISVDGFGATRPVADNGSEEGRRENRRVEIRVANDIAWR